MLLMPGKRAELESFRMHFRDSLGQLHAHLLAAGVSLVEPEKPLEGSTMLGKIIGSSDLLLTFGKKREAIIDMKWEGTTKYRDKLAKQTHVQLAIYGKLREQGTGRWPAVAYYILRRGEMLTTAPDLFPGVTAVANAGSTAELWQRIAATWTWRKKQIDAGDIELIFEGLEPTDESKPPPDALPIEPLDPRYNPFVTLAGWEA